MNEEKLKALNAVLAQIEKSYGKGAIMKLGSNAGNTDIEVIPTGCLSLDLALGVGAYGDGLLLGIAEKLLGSVLSLLDFAEYI